MFHFVRHAIIRLSPSPGMTYWSTCNTNPDDVPVPDPVAICSVKTENALLRIGINKLEEYMNPYACTIQKSRQRRRRLQRERKIRGAKEAVVRGVQGTAKRFQGTASLVTGTASKLVAGIKAAADQVYDAALIVRDEEEKRSRAENEIGLSGSGSTVSSECHLLSSEATLQTDVAGQTVPSGGRAPGTTGDVKERSLSVRTAPKLPRPTRSLSFSDGKAVAGEEFYLMLYSQSIVFFCR